MKDYILKAVNRRPLKFSGEKLGSNSDSTKSDISHELASIRSDWFTKLTLYRTKSGKIVLESEKIYSASYPLQDAEHRETTLELHESIEAYLASALNKKGEYGRATCALMNNVVDTHPELEEHWAESID